MISAHNYIAAAIQSKNPLAAVWHEVESVRDAIVSWASGDDYRALTRLFIAAAEAHGDSALTKAVTEGNDGMTWEMVEILTCDHTFDPAPLLAAMQVLASTISPSNPRR